MVAQQAALLAKDQPWTRAKLIVDGALTIAHDAETQFVTGELRGLDPSSAATRDPELEALGDVLQVIADALG